jgi:hypothetical protein
MGWICHEEVRKLSRLDLGDKARLIHLELALCADDETRLAHPGTQRLMETTRASRATVFRLLKRICQSAEVEQIQRGGGAGIAAEYRLADLDTLHGEGLAHDETQEGLIMGETHSHPESISPRRDPIGSQEGLKRVSPTRARVTALRNTHTPRAREITPDAVELCKQFADSLVDNGTQRPPVTDPWLDAAQAMLSDDRIDAQQIRSAIPWIRGHDFWRGRTTSMVLLRKHWATIWSQAKDEVRRDAAEDDFLAKLTRRSAGSVA